MQSLPDLIRHRSTPLEAQPTAATPRLPVLEGIRCVVFDVYGTLFVSGSGDIGITEAAQKATPFSPTSGLAHRQFQEAP